MDSINVKIRQIYDAFDSGNPTLALNLIQKQSKKLDFPLLTALKALALQRCGKKQEALEVCSQIKSTNPTDDAVLHAMTLVYRSTEKHAEIEELYGAAFNKTHSKEFAASKENDSFLI